MESKYTGAIIFTKRTNLTPWFDANVHPTDTRFGGNMEYSKAYCAQQEHYAKERDVQLIMLYRYDRNGIFARIKCPVNPLPIKGEFQIVSVSTMIYLLKSMGWEVKEKLNLHLFK